jgi:hypothetical protein
LKTLSSANIAVLLCTCGTSAAAQTADWDLSIDLRAVDSNGRESFLKGGQGKLRFDEHDDGLRLGRVRGGWNQRLGERFSAHLDASAWGDDDKSFVDLTEAYLQYRSNPRAELRSRVRLGAFFPPSSLENSATGWETPYSLTPSAISSWIGEEIRAIGLEGQMSWLGTDTDHAFELQLTAAAFGWNDPAGAQIAAHGFAVHDRQTTLFGRVGDPVASTAPKKEPFHEIDGRPGFYVGGQVRYLDKVVLSLFHYDNRADPTAFAPSLRSLAWETRFHTAALRIASDNGWSALGQWMSGDTEIAPRGLRRYWDFRSYSVLLAKTVGPHLVAARYDHFDVDFDPPNAAGNERGHAWVVAYSLERGENWRFTLEWLQVRSDVAARAVRLGEAPLATETQIELGVRYALEGAL